VSAAPWVTLLTEPELRDAAMSHAALRRKVRDGYLREAAELLGGSPRRLAGALHRYETSARYRIARRLAREDGSELDQALYHALAWGPCPTSARQLSRVLTSRGLAMSAGARRE
jgi:hypothetical protein